MEKLEDISQKSARRRTHSALGRNKWTVTWHARRRHRGTTGHRISRQRPRLVKGATPTATYLFIVKKTWHTYEPRYKVSHCELPNTGCSEVGIQTRFRKGTEHNEVATEFCHRGPWTQWNAIPSIFHCRCYISGDLLAAFSNLVPLASL